jgi:hypothetical protein
MLTVDGVKITYAIISLKNIMVEEFLDPLLLLGV